MEVNYSWPTRFQRIKFESKARLQRAVTEATLHYLNRALMPLSPREQASKLGEFLARLAPISSEHPLIRVGNSNDGGYLVPDDLEGVARCFSPGVSSVADFEAALVRRGIACSLTDYSVSNAPISGPLVSFEKKFLGTVIDDKYTTLSSWIGRLAPSTDNEMLMQMDIEGAEYEVLLDTPLEVLRRFRIVVVEFHYLDALLSPMGLKLAQAVFDKMLALFKVVHIHPNNSREPIRYGRFTIPPVMEITFHRSDRISVAYPATSFPHALDMPCCPWREDYPVPSCWYETRS